MVCGFPLWCRGLVYSVLLWYFLLILTYFLNFKIMFKLNPVNLLGQEKVAETKILVRHSLSNNLSARCYVVSTIFIIL